MHEPGSLRGEEHKEGRRLPKMWPQKRIGGYFFLSYTTRWRRLTLCAEVHRVRTVLLLVGRPGVKPHHCSTLSSVWEVSHS